MKKTRFVAFLLATILIPLVIAGAVYIPRADIGRVKLSGNWSYNWRSNTYSLKTHKWDTLVGSTADTVGAFRSEGPTLYLTGLVGDLDTAGASADSFRIRVYAYVSLDDDPAKITAWHLTDSTDLAGIAGPSGKLVNDSLSIATASWVKLVLKTKLASPDSTVHRLRGWFYKGEVN